VRQCRTDETPLGKVGAVQSTMGRAKGEDKCAKTIGMTNNKCGNTRLLVIPKRKCGKANRDRGETPVYRTKIDRGEDQKEIQQ
jgi:hypothetical protein